MVELSAITHSIHRKRCKNVLLFLFPLNGNKIFIMKKKVRKICTIIIHFTLQSNNLYTFVQCAKSKLGE